MVCLCLHSNSYYYTLPSGKTGGFALPLLQILMQQNRIEHQQQGGGYVSTLILCPTRELAAQTASVVQRLASYLHIASTSRKISTDLIHGGVPIEPQVIRLAKLRKNNDNLDV